MTLDYSAGPMSRGECLYKRERRRLMEFKADVGEKQLQAKEFLEPYLYDLVFSINLV